MTQNRTYDIVLYGASGFVGSLTAEYLAAHAPEGIRIALAGRSESKIHDVAQRIGGRALTWPILTADSFDPDALATIAQSTTVIISTVGPYFRFGKMLVNECAQAGTHYVDLCGEVSFMRYSIEENHELAQKTGAKIIHACGFDSVPSDIGMWLAHDKAAKAHAAPLKEATMVVKMKGGLSGGTIDSMRQQIALAQSDPSWATILQDPYSLSAARESEPDLGSQPDIGTIKLDEYGIPGGLAGPFMMAPCNTRVVRRSNSLMEWAYGKELLYREHTYMGTGLTGKKNNAAMLAMLLVLRFSLTHPHTRNFFSRWLPEPGDGPSQEERDNGFFSCTTYATSENGQRFTATVSLDADPGYKGTSLMLSEAALTLALQDNKDASGDTGITGGVLTPATALGEPYIARLRSAGMSLI